MIGSRVTFLGSQEEYLRNWLVSHPKGHERGAVILFRKYDRKVDGLRNSPRYLAIEIIKMDNDWVLDSSNVHLRINMRKFPDLYFRCENENLCLGFVHNHPTGLQQFSDQDTINEKNILKGLSGCNGLDSELISIVLSNNHYSARIRRGDDPNKVLPVRHLSILDSALSLHIDKQKDVEDSILSRQEAAFGKPFNQKLKSLRIAVVGAGGTGSPLATLLARSGVGELIIIDGDSLEKSNLNRVRGYKKSDVGRKKATSLSEYITSLELDGVSAISIPEYLDESVEAIDALSSSDVIFGCTDDQLGRELMNQALYYYGNVYIDLGLTGRVDEDELGNPYLRDHRGRISCILPESGACLRCQRVVSDEKLAYEAAIKSRPELKELDAETLKEEHYLVGGGEQAPGVGPFTSATANYGVMSLMDLLRGFRKIPSDLRQDNIWLDFVHLDKLSNEPKDDISCIYCRKKSLLLKKEKSYRLDMPKLGKL